MSTAERRYGLALSLLLAAFVGRVVAQLLQLWRPNAWLPPFAAWHSSLLPYPLLLALQALIIGLGLWAIVRVYRGVAPSERLGRVLRTAGVLYAAVMAVRLGLGLTVLRHVPWFASYLPTAFHFVLAGFLLTLGMYALRRTKLACDAR